MHLLQQPPIFIQLNALLGSSQSRTAQQGETGAGVQLNVFPRTSPVAQHKEALAKIKVEAP